MINTAEEWLNNNQLSIDIFNKKYRYNNETFNEWLNRVSGGNQKIRQLILEKKFLFGGRTLSNRGVPNSGSFSNCFVAGSKIICKRGLINIENIVIGDEVLSADGKFHKVNDTMKHHYTGDLYKIESHEIYAPIICTPNHKFLTNWGWKRADRIFPQGVSYTGKGQDMLKTAYFDGDSYFYKAGEGELVDLTDGYIVDDKHRIVYSDDNLASLEIYVNVSPVKDKEYYVWKTFGNPINHKVTLTSDFLYFIGRWIGDGSITCRKGQHNPSILQIVFNATTERDAAERCQRIGEEVFGILANVTETKQNVIAVRFESPFISSWFLKNFGEKCDGKFIPNKFLGNRDILCGIIDSDGSINTHGAIKLVLKNKNLLQWVKDTCYLNGINTGQIKDISYRQEATGQLCISVTQANAKLNKYLMKDYHDKRQNKVARGNSEYIYIPSIEVLEDQERDVYNISVEEDHTYTVNGVIVHNCYSIGYVPDSLDGIMDVAHKIAMTFKAQGGQGLSLSKIRPKGSLIAGQFQSDGIVPFMNIFNTVTESISQGGCIYEEELILTNRGLKKIKDIKIGDLVWTKKGYIEVNYIWDKGISPIYEVTTKSGLKIKTTLSHKFNIDGFTGKKLEDLKVGDKIVTILGDSEASNIFNSALYTLGAFLANGTINQKRNGGNITFASNIPTGCDIVAKYLQDLTGEYPSIYENDKYYRVALSKLAIEHLGYIKNSTSNIEIPECVFNSSIDDRLSFIAGLIDTDGCTYNNSFKYSTISERFADQLVVLLNSVGYFPKKSVQFRENRQPLYEIRCSVFENSPIIPSYKFNSNTKEVVRNCRNKTPFTIENLGITKRTGHLKKLSKTDTIGYYTYIQECLDYYKPCILEEIVSIIPSGEGHVYDISLVEEHFFSCNGFYVSNSRKGALLMSISAWHPEVETFIKIKEDLNKINKANLSVEIDDNFMLGVLGGNEYCNKIFNTICTSAWRSAEPGILFTERLRKYNIMEFVANYQIETTNPCGRRFPHVKHRSKSGKTKCFNIC